MPESEVVQSGAMTDADRLSALQEILTDGRQDIAPLVTDDQVEPADGEVVSARSQGSMERVSLAIIEASANKRGSRADIAAAIAKAGLTPAMFMQMSDSPDFWPVFKSFVKRLVYMSRYVDIQMALTERARAGDPRAARELRESFDKDVTEGWDDFARSLLRSGDEQLTGEAEKLVNDLSSLLSDLRTPPQPMDVKQDVITDLVLGSGEVRDKVEPPKHEDL